MTPYCVRFKISSIVSRHHLFFTKLSLCTKSEEAYYALKKLKREGESFSDVILRITRSYSLLEYVESTEFPQDLADGIEDVYRSREKVGSRLVEL